MGVVALLSSTALGLTLDTRADKSVGLGMPFEEADAPALGDALDIIEKMPDSALESNEAVTAWVNSQQVASQVAVRDADALESRQSLPQIIACAAAIIQAIADNAIPLAKLRRLRSLIKALGGARKTAKLLLKAKTIKQMIRIGGPKLEEIAYILLGVQDVVANCFNF